MGLALRRVSQNLLHIWAGTKFDKVGLKKARCLDVLVFIPDLAEALNPDRVHRTPTVRSGSLCPPFVTRRELRTELKGPPLAIRKQPGSNIIYKSQ